MEGMAVRRPRIATGVTPISEILRIESGARLNLFHCIFDNRGSIGNCISVASNACGEWERIRINGGSSGKSGLCIEDKGRVEMIDVSAIKFRHYYSHVYCFSQLLFNFSL